MRRDKADDIVADILDTPAGEQRYVSYKITTKCYVTRWTGSRYLQYLTVESGVLDMLKVDTNDKDTNRPKAN